MANQNYQTLSDEEIDRLCDMPFQPREHGFVEGRPYILKNALRKRFSRIDRYWTISEPVRLPSEHDTIVLTAFLKMLGMERPAVGTGVIVCTDRDGKNLLPQAISRNEVRAYKTAHSDLIPRLALEFGIGAYLKQIPKNVVDERSLTEWLKSTFQPKTAPTAVPPTTGTTPAQTSGYVATQNPTPPATISEQPVAVPPPDPTPVPPPAPAQPVQNQPPKTSLGDNGKTKAFSQIKDADRVQYLFSDASEYNRLVNQWVLDGKVIPTEGVEASVERIRRLRWTHDNKLSAAFNELLNESGITEVDFWTFVGTTKANYLGTTEQAKSVLNEMKIKKIGQDAKDKLTASFGPPASEQATLASQPTAEAWDWTELQAIGNKYGLGKPQVFTVLAGAAGINAKDVRKSTEQDVEGKLEFIFAKELIEQAGKRQSKIK